MRAFAMSLAFALGLMVGIPAQAQVCGGGFNNGFNNGFRGGVGGFNNGFRGGVGGFNNGFGGRQVVVVQQRPVRQRNNVIQLQNQGILGGRRSVLIQSQRVGGIF
jgi:hypothetical protein